jgi:hypothetical protein
MIYQAGVDENSPGNRVKETLRLKRKRAFFLLDAYALNLQAQQFSNINDSLKYNDKN